MPRSRQRMAAARPLGLAVIVLALAIPTGGCAWDSASPTPTPFYALELDGPPANQTAVHPQPGSPTVASSCFGTSDFKLDPVEGAISRFRQRSDASPGQSCRPRQLPEYATRGTGGIANTSIGDGRPAFVLQFACGLHEFPFVTLIYADRGVCELAGLDRPIGLSKSKGTMSTCGFPNLKIENGVHGVIVMDNLGVDITMAWPRSLGLVAAGSGELPR